jgi:hypothetical protein
MTRRAAITAAMATDAAVVVVFAAIGRRSHDEPGGVGRVLGTAAPFLVGLAVAWIAVGLGKRARGRDDRLLVPADGVGLALVTTAVGLVLRRTLWDRGTAATFAVVAAAFLTAGMTGWRAVVSRRRSRQDVPRSTTG